MVKRLTESNDYNYKGYTITFKNEGEVSILDKDFNVVRSGMSDAEAREWIDSNVLSEDKIADKIRANQDTKEMTKRAIRTIKNLGGQYDDLVKDFKDAYGEDPLEESAESSDLHFVKRAFSYDIYGDGNSYVLLDGDGDVVYTSDNTLDCLKWAKKNSSKAWNFNNVWDWDRLKESSELTDKDWEEFYGLEDELSKIMNSVDSDMDDYQGDIYHNTYDDTLRLHYLTYPSKINNKWASTLEKKLRDFFEKSTRFTDVDYIDIYRKKDTSPLDLLTYVVDIRAFDPTIGREEESLKESFEGMTIRDWIVDGMTRAAEDRLQKLTDMNAPQIMIDRQSEMIDELKSGKIPITGDLKALDLPLENREIKTGRGGKTYFSINDGKVNYFPYAKYGPYIKMVEESLKESPGSYDRKDYEDTYLVNWRDSDGRSRDTLVRGVKYAQHAIDKVKDKYGSINVEILGCEEVSLFTSSKRLKNADELKESKNDYNQSIQAWCQRNKKDIIDTIREYKPDTLTSSELGEWCKEAGFENNKTNRDIFRKELNRLLRKEESLKESIDDFIGETFIEDGVEYEWITQYGDEVETSTGTWAVWEASPTESDDENPETYFFVVDVDDGFIDWGPCETVEEAAEFLESKESDEDEEEDNDWFDDEYDYDAEYERARDEKLLGEE